MAHRREDIDREMLAAEYEAVFRYALALCRDETLAQDITQDTFMRALSTGSRFAGDSSLYTWLCSIAKNLWLDICRKSGREVSLDEQGMLVPDGDSIEQRAADRSTSREIHRILHTLDEPYKEVFSLRVFGQLSFADIAELFGKTESWARVTYHRARKKIAEQMRKDGTL